MKIRRFGLYPHVVIGLPALVLATSCVPGDRSVAALRRHPVSNSRDLLRAMALHVPDDISAKMPVAQADAPFATAPAVTTIAPPFLATSRSADDAARATECLTAAVYYEARSQAVEGQRAVAQVVLNRVRDRAFPSSVCGVVYQGSERRTGCQFSFTCDGSMNRAREVGAWDRARAVAEAALGGSVFAPVGAATSFHTTSILPWWASSLARITTVGAHVFYRWQGALERALTFRQAYAGVEPGVGGLGYARGAVADAVVTEVAGVAVHYGNREVAADTGVVPADVNPGMVAAVTIHRGKTHPAPAMAQARLVSGVRVHVGERGSAMLGDGDGFGAIVSDET